MKIMKEMSKSLEIWHENTLGEEKSDILSTIVHFFILTPQFRPSFLDLVIFNIFQYLNASI